MKCAVDIHIHTALSPCADDDMTPNNIVNMAKLKGLDIIAITDHNSCENCLAVMKCGEKAGITVIPGMEVCTAEEVHIITLFRDIFSALKFQEIVYENLPETENREDIFGKQIVYDENDEIVTISKKFLIGAVKLSVEEVFSAVKELQGIAIPAHIDRSSYSIISNLGMIPENLDIDYLELSKDCDKKLFFETQKIFKEYKVIKSSDAHYLGDILERKSFLNLNGKKIRDFFYEFKRNP